MQVCQGLESKSVWVNRAFNVNNYLTCLSKRALVQRFIPLCC